MRQRAQVREQSEDIELARLAATGDLGAFEELYRRHVEAAWRMALAVTSNPHDAADAVSDAFTRVFQALPERPQAAGHFLPYLLAAVRNTAIDGLRRGGRQRAATSGEQADRASPGAGPGERLEADVEAAFVSSAFRSLPERWRSVLWLTEVEGFAARDVAILLGMTPNGVAQLAVRARAGLRQRYLQAHLRQTEVRSCRDTVSRLGAYVAGGLAPRDVSKVDQHLAGCEACRSRLAQLRDVTPCLYRAVLPLPVALAALSAAKLQLGATGATAGAAATTTSMPAGIGVGVVAAVLPAPLVATFASAALLVAGFVGAGIVGDRSHRQATAITEAPAPVTATFVAASVPEHPAPAAGGDPLTGLLDEAARAADLAAVSDLVARVGRDLPDLPAAAPAALVAAARGDVRIDLGAAAAAVDLGGGSRPCPSSRVFWVDVGCRSAGGQVSMAPDDPPATSGGGGAGAADEAIPLADGLRGPQEAVPAP